MDFDLYSLTVYSFYILLFLWAMIVAILCRPALNTLVTEMNYFGSKFSRRQLSWNTLALDIMAIFIVGFLVRSFLSDHNFYHCNAHGFQYVYKSINLFTFREYRSCYGLGGFSFFHIFLQAFSRNEITFFYTNIVLGSLSCSSVYILSASLFKRRDMAFWAGLALAFLPSHIRISGSEILSIGGALFCITALSFFAIYDLSSKHDNAHLDKHIFRIYESAIGYFYRKPLESGWMSKWMEKGSGKRAFLIAGALSLSIGVQFLEIFNLYFIIGPLFLFVLSRGAFYKRMLLQCKVILLMILFCIPHLTYMLTFGAKQMRDAGYSLLFFNITNVVKLMFTRVNSLLDPSITPIFMILMLFAGIFATVIKKDKYMFLLIFITAAFSIVDFMKTLTVDNRLIFHVDYHPYVAIIIAFGIISIADLLISRLNTGFLKYPILAILTCMLISSPFWARKFLRHRNNTQRTLSFMQKHIETRDNNVIIVTILQDDIGKYDPAVPYPMYSSLRVLSINNFLKYHESLLQPENGIILLYFESPACYTYDLADFTGDINQHNFVFTYSLTKKYFDRVNSTRISMKRDICKKIENTFSMVPIKTEEFDNDADTLSPVMQKRIRIGLYEIRRYGHSNNN